MPTTMLAASWGERRPRLRRELSYDAGGRPVAEDRSPCLASQRRIRRPILRPAMGPRRSIASTPSTRRPPRSPTARGARWVSTRRCCWAARHRALARKKTIPAYDALGRVTAVGVRIQKPGTAQSVLANSLRASLVREEASLRRPEPRQSRRHRRRLARAHGSRR